MGGHAADPVVYVGHSSGDRATDPHAAALADAFDLRPVATESAVYKCLDAATPAAVVVAGSAAASADAIARAVDRIAPETPVFLIDADDRPDADAVVGVLSDPAPETVVHRVRAALDDRSIDDAIDEYRRLQRAAADATGRLAEAETVSDVETALHDALVAGGPCSIGLPVRRRDDRLRIGWTATGAADDALGWVRAPIDAVDRALSDGTVVVDDASNAAALPLGRDAGWLVLSDRALDAADRAVLDDVTGAARRARDRVVEAPNTAAEGPLDPEAFAEMVVHELRTPVEVGRGRAELAAAESADPETLDAIVASFDRISDVLDAVLSLVHADVDPDDATPRDLGATARDAWSDLNDAADATLAVASSRPVVADHDLLDRLFSNLFRNALEHAGPDPTVRVAVTDAPETTDGDALTPGEIGFAVSDDGLGIPPEDRDRVFEPGESETGTGFGLAIVDRIAAAHGWTARVTESEDGGARFEFVPDS